jgi:hypothetical protein
MAYLTKFSGYVWKTRILHGFGQTVRSAFEMKSSGTRDQEEEKKKKHGHGLKSPDDMMTLWPSSVLLLSTFPPQLVCVEIYIFFFEMCTNVCGCAKENTCVWQWSTYLLSSEHPLLLKNTLLLWDGHNDGNNARIWVRIRLRVHSRPPIHSSS